MHFYGTLKNFSEMRKKLMEEIDEEREMYLPLYAGYQHYPSLITA
jgi:hypothetical protein